MFLFAFYQTYEKSNYDGLANTIRSTNKLFRIPSNEAYFKIHIYL